MDLRKTKVEYIRGETKGDKRDTRKVHSFMYSEYVTIPKDAILTLAYFFKNRDVRDTVEIATDLSFCHVSLFTHLAQLYLYI